jgi:hypothetical protein
MTAAILWIMRILCAYFIIKIVFAVMRGAAPKDQKKDFKKKPSVRRFNGKGKDISDAEYNEIDRDSPD